VRIVIDLEREADGRWRATVPTLDDVVAYGANPDSARHNVIGQALSRLDETNDVTFVSGDQEWHFTDAPPPEKPPFVRPTTVEEVVEAVASWPKLRIVGRDTNAPWRVPSAAEVALPSLELRRLQGIVEYDVSDQVVVVRAGTSVEDLNAELAKEGQCIPLGPPVAGASVGSVGGALAMNRPHLLEGQTGGWRDWVLGLGVVTASGEVVKCGSKAVKNVAGYDVQKLLIGARGTLGVVVEVTLRTLPLRALPVPRIVAKGDLSPLPLTIHRVLPTDFEAAMASYPAAVGDPATGTIWANGEPVRFSGDWVIRSGCGERNLQFTDPTQIRFMRRAKDLFDPTHKLNPGEMGIF
jgi:glycolate oxidase FAD binding subunit